MSTRRAQDRMVRVLLALFVQPQHRSYGYELTKLTGLTGPAIYRALEKLEDMGVVHGFWETDPPAWRATPRRRYYMLSPRGERLAEQVSDRRGPSGSEPLCGP